MKLAALYLAVVLACGACSTSYVTPPSTAKIVSRSASISTHVEVAKVSADAARKRAATAETKATAARTANAGTKANLQAAETALGKADYTGVARSITLGLAANASVLSLLDNTLEELQSARSNFDSITLSLDAALSENEKLKADATELQGEVSRLVVDGAGDHVIAVRCRSWFGLGAIFYGIEHLLKAGIVGILILGAVVLVLVILGWVIGGPFGAVVFRLVGSVFRKKAPE